MIKCIIVDDEHLAIDILEEYIQRIDRLKLVGRCKNAIEAYNLLQKDKVDLIFLDIQMPQLSGIDFLKNLTNPPKVILTTAYSEYALDGFELDVLDYLLKPITFNRFLKAVNKFIVQTNHPYPFIEQNTKPESQKYENAFMYLKSDKVMVKVKLIDILYIESLKNYVKIYTSGKEIKTFISITQMEQKLPASKFIRIHRSFIVPIDKVEAFSQNTIHIENKILPIGRSYKREVKKHFDYGNE